MVKHTIFLIMLFIVGCGVKTTPINNNVKYKARGIVITTLAYSSSHKSQDTKPDDASDVCPICDGTGLVGDGTHFAKCLTCDGTGKVKPRSTIAMPPELPQGFDDNNVSIDTVSGTSNELLLPHIDQPSVVDVVEVPTDEVESEISNEITKSDEEFDKLNQIRKLEDSQKQILEMLNQLKPSVDIITNAIQKSSSKKD